MQQVTDWLEKLGLGQDAQRFAECFYSARPHRPRKKSGCRLVIVGKKGDRIDRSGA
jgi:hypothetical protein